MSSDARRRRDPDRRTPRAALIAIGSNIEPERYVPAALDALDELLGLDAVSGFYVGEPVGAPGTPRFVNAAALITTDREPQEIKFGVLRPLEERLDRVRSGDPNAPRTIDLDLAAVEGLVMEDDDVRLPDPEIVRHPHLALPLADVAPDFIHPIEGVTLARIASRFRNATGIHRLHDFEWPGR